MFYYIYKVTNLINGKFYVGAHKTNNIDDGYMGSGKLLKQALIKYGQKNFKKDILEFFDSENEMFSREKELVDSKFLSSDENYNLSVGGQGGFGYINSNNIPKFLGKKHTEETKKLLSEKARGQIIKEETRQKLKDNHWSKKDPEAQRIHARKASTSSRKNNHVSDKVKKKISYSLLGRRHTTCVCPYCGKEGSSRLMKRWHFMNCKEYR